MNEVETQRQEILTLRAENEKLREAVEKQNQIQNLLQYSQKKKLKLQFTEKPNKWTESKDWLN